MSYPTTLDTYTAVDGTTLVATADHAAMHNTVGSAVVKIETTLGTNSGTAVLKDATAGKFAVMNSGGTLNAGVLGTPMVRGGTVGTAVIGTSSVIGGTVGTALFAGGTVGTALIGTSTIIGGTIGTALVGTSNITGGTSTATKFIGHYGAIATATDGGTVTFDLTAGNIQQVTLGGNRVLALSGEQVGQPFAIRLVQDGTGTRTVTWFSTIKWPGGNAPTLTTTAAKTDVLGFIVTTSGNYDGYIIGMNL